MALEARVEEESKKVVHGNGQKQRTTNGLEGETLIVKVTWTPTKRGKKYYYYPRVTIPSRIAEKIGLKPKEEVEFEIHLVNVDGERAILLKPLRKIRHAEA